MMEDTVTRKGPILHVIVVGFHHKKGCQVEYAYPPLIPGNSVESHQLPDEWKHLPSLALPDGAHNFEKDTVYFHLKSLGETNTTVFGISCCQQMDANDLVNKTADVTRSTVQKSVCVLSTLPLYGLIKAKLHMITHVYFDQRDFTMVSLLEETYNNLVSCVQESSLHSQVFLGLSIREIVLRYRHKIVLLFKLLLLERKVLFFMNPVETLCSTILAMLSLYPGMIERGLNECSSYTSSKVMTPTLKMHDIGKGEGEEFMTVEYLSNGQADVAKKLDKKEELSLSDGSSQNLAEKCDDEIMEKSMLKDDCEEREAFQSSSEGCVPQKMVDFNRQVSSTGSNKSITLSESDINDLPEVFHLKNKEKPAHSEGHSPVQIHSKSHHDSSSSSHSFDKEAYPGHVEPVVVSKDDSAATLKGEGCKDLSHVHTSKGERKDHGDAHSSVFTKHAEKHSDLVVDIGNVSIPKVGIPELDSPEGLSEIDAEDRFHWGKESLTLAMLSDSEPSDAETKVISLDSFGELLPDSVEVEDPVYKAGENEDTEEMLSFVNENYALPELEEHSLSRSSSKKSSLSIGDSFDENAPSKASRRSKESTPERIAKTASEVRDKLASALSRKKSSSIEFLERVEPTGLSIDGMGMPLSIFTKGSLCHPYAALQQYDLIEDVNIRSFVIGATNVLFKQRRHLSDVVVGEEELQVEIRDPELRKQLHLTTADLRFADYLVKTVQEDKDDLFLDGTEWEGGDEWLRSQFRLYLVSLMSAVLQDDEKMLEDFNLNFVNAWKMTHNYIVWRNTLQEIKDVQVGHPFHGQINLSDMKLRLSTSMQGTERGRKINAAVSSTGRVVAETSKVVGGALHNAKSAVSSWFSSFGSKSE